jgi:hypothetical protein
MAHYSLVTFQLADDEEYNRAWALLVSSGVPSFSTGESRTASFAG